MDFQGYVDATRGNALDAVESDDYDWTSCDVDDVMEALWVDDAVTGNGSGSYTCDRREAERLTAGLIWDPEFRAELDGLGIALGELVDDGPEAVDVTARCIALDRVRDDVEAALEARAECRD